MMIGARQRGWKKERLALSLQINPTFYFDLAFFSSAFIRGSPIRAGGGVERRRRNGDNVIGITIEKRLCISQVSLQGVNCTSFLTSCAGMTRHASREFFSPKIAIPPFNFKYNPGETNYFSVIIVPTSSNRKRRIIVYGSVTRYGPQSVASASG